MTAVGLCPAAVSRRTKEASDPEIHVSRTPAFAALLLALACGASKATAPKDATEGQPAAPPLKEGQAEAVFAGGCFWCVESEYDDLPGVISAESGYIGGKETGPTYESVSYGRTGHTEAVRVVYDPKKTDYATLLDVFWHNIDPTQSNGQFCDKGRQYRTGVFYVDPEQRKLAEATSKIVAERLGAPVVTEVTKAGTFWLAEEYHQDYHHKNSAHYQRYRLGCGRDRRLQQLWGETPVSVLPKEG